ncbi:MAG: GNAT family N-acetyltransferase [Bdellovibrionales bacterium]
MKIRRVTTQEVLPLRGRILRPGLPLEACRYPADPKAVHFGLEIGGALVCVVTAHPEDSPLAGACKNPWRIRGMATASEVQGRGYGSLVLKALLEWAPTEGIDVLWCNAREKAIPFYERHGFSCVSDLFEIPEIGPHKVMRISLI